MSSCAIYEIFEQAGLLETWKMAFCSAGYEKCARYQLTVQNRPVPLSLLPNGKKLNVRRDRRVPDEQ